ncbi:MAG: 2-hydroxyglutaryl-CoA dehydratase, partial [Deltaproteobacteria bacterium]|nr:2-hydroxyglutaryl-CoA dehydratase [Deltaproteobacteria bacterium]
MRPTGFRLAAIAETVFEAAVTGAGLDGGAVSYVVATGTGRHQVQFKDVAVTDLTAAARGVNFFFPEARTVLDVGGQTMKATRLDDKALVKSFRLNDKCAAGTGAFLEKTARYMGYSTEEIGPLM